MIINRDMQRRLRTAVALTAVSASSLVLAACGSSDDGDPAAAEADQTDDKASDEVASLGTVADAASDDSSASDGGSGEPTEAEMQEAALDYAKCMREHGVDMPDPQFNADAGGGGVAIAVGGPGAEIDPEAMEAADEACRPIMDEIRSQFEPPDPEQLEQMKQQALEFAQCMREHGVDMPDPQFSEDGAMTVAVGGGRLGEEGSGVAPIDEDKFQEASEACGGPGGGVIGVAVEGESGDGDAPEVMVNAVADEGEADGGE